jgi:hypothetical protein
MLCDVTFDRQFNSIVNLKHYPWIGKGYLSAPVKLLILGDSHYTVDNDGMFSLEEYNRCINDKNYTRDTLNCAVGTDYAWSFYKGLYDLLSISPYEAEQKLWDKVVFYNFVQTPMQQRDATPTEYDFKEAWFCLLDVIDIIQPSLCLFIGTRGWVSNGYINLENRGTCNIKYDKRISGCYPWKADILTKAGICSHALAIHHTSQGFSPTIWREYIRENAPSIFEILDTSESNNNELSRVKDCD